MKSPKILLSIFFLTCLSPFYAAEKTHQEMVKEINDELHEQSKRIAKEFYLLEEGKEWQEMTDSILKSDETKESAKELIRSTGRRFFLFKYPSEGFQVKGYLSFVPQSDDNPLLIYFRGGNRIFGINHPASDLACAHNYTVISSAYRGGVSEGKDEYGGAEVNDIQNLMDYFPALQEKLGIRLSPKKTFMLARGRGAMQMFLALNRFPALQQQVAKIASLTGVLDVQDAMVFREEMRPYYMKVFGLTAENEETWIAQRSPILNIGNLRKDLPILILEGTNNVINSIKGTRNMVDALKNQGNAVTYIEVEGGVHSLENHPNRMQLITTWLEE